MNIIRYLYIELNSDKTVETRSFETKAEAVFYAGQRLRETVSAVLGADYIIPENHIDESGNIWHSNGGTEIYSSEYDWALWRDGSEEARASVEEKVIELSPAEMLSLYDAQTKEFLLEDAKRQLLDYAEYAFLTPDSADFLVKHGFTLEQAVDCNSEHYLLESIVDRYTDMFDCNVPENDLWLDAIESVLKDILPARKII